MEEEPKSFEVALERGPDVLRAGMAGFRNAAEFFSAIEHQYRRERIKMVGDLLPLGNAIGASFDYIPHEFHHQLAEAFLNGVALGGRVAKQFLSKREQALIGEVDIFARMNSHRAPVIPREFVDEARTYGHVGYEHARSFQGLLTELSRELYKDTESEQVLKEGFGLVFHGMMEAQAMAARFDATDKLYSDNTYTQMRAEAIRIEEVGWDDDAELRALLGRDD